MEFDSVFDVRVSLFCCLISFMICFVNSRDAFVFGFCSDYD
jgi:hypothetical protein